MSTLKSDDENLILNAGGADKDIIFQSDGTEKARLDKDGIFAATSFSGSGAALTDITSFQAKILTGNGNFTVPDGVTTIYVTAVGGGGGGGGQSVIFYNGTSNNSTFSYGLPYYETTVSGLTYASQTGGAGGTGANTWWNRVSVTPGDIIPYWVGVGGTFGQGVPFNQGTPPTGGYVNNDGTGWVGSASNGGYAAGNSGTAGTATKFGDASSNLGYEIVVGGGEGGTGGAIAYGVFFPNANGGVASGVGDLSERRGNGYGSGGGIDDYAQSGATIGGEGGPGGTFTVLGGLDTTYADGLDGRDGNLTIWY